jgi:hypothetical protein
MRRWSMLAIILAFASACAPAELPAACRVTGVGPETDHERARAACERAVDRFTLLYGVAPPAGVVEISDTVLFFSVAAHVPEWRMVWPTTEGIREYFGEPRGQQRSEAVENHWLAVLPHEIGHLMLIAEADVRRPPELEPSRLPDWLHEGTAVWMEPPVTREPEYATLRALGPYIPPLAELTTLSVSGIGGRGEAGSTIVQTFFPCASEEGCGGRPHWDRIFSVRTRQYLDGTVQIDTTFHERPPPPPSPVAAYFYPYSATLVRYVYDRGGAAAMRELLDRYARDPQRRDALVGLPGLPADPRRLEADWREWFTRWILQE